MHPIIQTPRDRQLILGSGVRVQSAGYTAGGVESAYAVAFDGSNSVVVSGSVEFGTGDFAISVWVKLLAIDGYRVFVGKDNSITGARDWVLSVGGEVANKWNFVNFRGGGNYLASTTNPVANYWTHLVFTRASGTLRLFINGIEDASVSNNANYNGTGNITLGNREGLFKNPSECMLDDLRFYSRALTAAEIQSMYRNSSSPPTSGLVAYFPLDEGTGTTTIDEIAGLIGTLTNGPTWSTDVPAALQ